MIYSEQENKNEKFSIFLVRMNWSYLSKSIMAYDLLAIHSVFGLTPAGDQTRWIIDSWSCIQWYKQGIWVLERTKLCEGPYQVLS